MDRVQPQRPRAALQFLADGAFGLAVFTIITILWFGPSTAGRLAGVDGLLSTSAQAHQLSAPQPLSFAGVTSMPQTFDPQLALVTLALAFSAMFALNLAFARHLKRSYALQRAVAKLRRS